MWEAEIIRGRIKAQGQLRQIVHETPISKTTRSGLVEWLKG
jgi:hypothetical protein